MLLDKKGEMTTIRKLILFLITLGVLLAFTMFFVDNLQGSVSQNSCSNWVNTQSAVKVVGTPIKELNSPCLTFGGEIKGDEEEVFEQVAQNLFVCWDMYGRGKVDFYSNWDWGFGDTHCRVCSDPVVGSVKKNKFDIDKFEIYLSKEKPPYNDKTYAEIFVGTEDAKIDFGEKTIPLRKGSKLYSLFAINKQSSEDFLSFSKEFGLRSAGSGIFLGVTCGAVAFYTAGIGILPCLEIGGAIGLLGNAVYSAGQKSYFIPSLHLVSGDDIDQIKKICGEDEANIYYKPEKKFGLGDFGKDG